MSIGWIASTFCYFLMDFFVKYLPGSIYVNQLVASLSMFGYLMAEPLAAITNNKQTQLISFVIALIALLIMLLCHHLNEYLFALIFLLMKSAYCMNFSALFCIHNDLFPTQLLASSYGFCNFLARLFTLLAPLLAEVENREIPMYVMIVITLLALFATIGLKVSYK